MTSELRPPKTQDLEDFLRCHNLEGRQDREESEWFQRIGYIEKMRTGLNKMIRLVDTAGLSPIEFEFDTFFTAVFHRPAGAGPQVAGGILPEEFREKFSVNFRLKGTQLTRMVSIIERLASGKIIAVPGLAAEFGVSLRTIDKELGKLLKWGLVEFRGAPKTGAYVLISVISTWADSLVRRSESQPPSKHNMDYANMYYRLFPTSKNLHNGMPCHELHDSRGCSTFQRQIPGSEA